MLVILVTGFQIVLHVPFIRHQQREAKRASVMKDTLAMERAVIRAPQTRHQLPGVHLAFAMQGSSATD